MDSNNGNTLTKKVKRDTGPEVLRILSMMFIILHHLGCYRVYELFGFNAVAMSVIEMAGKVGVNAFVLITGYYSINSTTKLKKTIMLICETVFYSVTVYSFCVIAGAGELSEYNVLSALLPFFSSTGNWFIINYVILYLLLPFLNAGLKRLNRLQHFGLIALLAFMWSVFPAFVDPLAPFNCRTFNANDLEWLVMLYCIGAYIKLYQIKLKEKKSLSFIVFGAFTAMSVACKLINEFVTYDETRIIDNVTKIVCRVLSDCDDYGFASLMMGIFIFICSLHISVKPTKLLYLLSGSTFGVYLIHDNHYFRDYLWGTICKVGELAESAWYLPAVFGFTIAVFAVGTVIDLIRKNIIEKPIFSSKLYAKVENISAESVKKFFNEEIAEHGTDNDTI